jgi:hypothetical protein
MDTGSPLQDMGYKSSPLAAISAVANLHDRVFVADVWAT